NPTAIFGELVREGQRVADVGCGGGFFSLALARMVGPEGKVISIDVQPEMLNRVRNRARRRGLDQVIDLRLCEADRLGLEEPLDFVLSFWMAHEVADQEGFLTEIRSALEPSGILLLAEPRVHVPASRLQETVDTARGVGFDVAAGPEVRFSRSILCSP
ncbi:MAG: methyltransferase domain-containing protein, partial [Acidobacteriota bacterium]